MSGLQQVVAKFLAEREQVITAINNCPASNMEDYWRWQGNAEARRTLSQDLKRDGINLTDEPAPVTVSERVAKVLDMHYYDASWSKAHQGFRCVCSWLGDSHVQHVTDMLAAATFRDEATVKAEAIREAAQVQRQLAADARTQYGEAEHTNIADWLDEHATAIDPRRLEGAHP